MAQKKDESHAFNSFFADLKSHELANVLLLFGSETFLVDWAVQQIKDVLIDPATEALDYIVLEKGAVDATAIAEAAETLPMVSEKKVVVVEEIKAVDQDIIDYLSQAPSHAIIVLKAQTKEDNSAAEKQKNLLAKFAGVYEMDPLGEADLNRFISKRFQNAGLSAESDSIGLLVAMSGYQNKDIEYALYNLENDINKIIAVADGEVVTDDDVLRGISDNIENNIFKMLDAISNNNKDVAFKMLHDIIKSGGKEQQILASIVGQLELMLEVKQYAKGGMRQQEIAKILKVHEFRVKKAASFQQKFSDSELKRVLGYALDSDDRVKSGLIPAQLALELLIANI